MASDKKDGQGPEGDNQSTTLKEQTKSTAVSDELDLDKNPIKFATSEPGKFITDPHDKDYMELTLRAGKHSELAQKLLRQKIEMRAKEFPRWPGDQSAGVRVMWIESRFWYDRERLGPDFDQDWREYRAKYLNSLKLDPREPIHVPEYEYSLINPIRRFYMRGGDFLENHIIRRFITNNKWWSAHYRISTTRFIMMYLGMIAGYYYIRYNHYKWDMSQGLDLLRTQPIMYPDHPRYPFQDYRTEPGHHCDKGFSRRTIYKDLRDYEDMTNVL